MQTGDSGPAIAGEAIAKRKKVAHENQDISYLGAAVRLRCAA